jgi:hypothetical protein
MRQMKKLALGVIFALMLLALVTSLAAMAHHASESQTEEDRFHQATTIPPPAVTPTVPVTGVLKCDVSVEGFAPLGNEALLKLRNNGRAAVTILALEVAWPVVRNRALLEVKLNAMTLWRGENTTTPTTIVPLTAAAVPDLGPGQEADLAFAFAEQAADAPYTITVFFVQGCAAFFSTEDAADLPRHIHFEGSIEALPDDPDFLGQWIVGGRTVVVDERTVIVPSNLPPEVGDWARVKAIAVNRADAVNASFLATYIGIVKPVDQKGRLIEFAGPIEETADDESYIIVRGITVTIDAHTVIVCHFVAATDANCPLTVGSTVQVGGYLRADGTVLARKIVVGPRTFMVSYVEFEGPIEAFTDTIPADWIIGGRRVRVDEETVVEGTPRLGAMAEVQALSQPSGILRARLIRIEGEDAVNLTTVKIQGLIQHLPDDPQFLGQWIILRNREASDAPLIVTVDESTFIDESRARVQVGARVEVDARYRVLGPLLALRIRVEREEQEG